MNHALYVHIWIYACYVRIYANICLYIYEYMRLYIYIYIYICVCVYTYVCMYMSVYMYKIIYLSLYLHFILYIMHTFMNLPPYIWKKAPRKVAARSRAFVTCLCKRLINGCAFASVCDVPVQTFD